MPGQTNWTLVASLGGSPGINSQDADADVDASLIGLSIRLGKYRPAHLPLKNKTGEGIT